MKSKALFKLIKNYMPNVPHYVFKELLYHPLIRYVSNIEEKDWNLEVRKVSVFHFCSETQRRMRERKFGLENPYKIPNDSERMETQRKSAVPGNNEPIIVFETPDGLELLEGWHRTMALLTHSGDPEVPVEIRMWIGSLTLSKTKPGKRDKKIS
jgi:hypothetical protein